MGSSIITSLALQISIPSTLVVHGWPRTCNSRISSCSDKPILVEQTRQILIATLLVSAKQYCSKSLRYGGQSAYSVLWNLLCAQGNGQAIFAGTFCGLD